MIDLETSSAMSKETPGNHVKYYIRMKGEPGAFTPLLPRRGTKSVASATRARVIDLFSKRQILLCAQLNVHSNTNFKRDDANLLGALGIEGVSGLQHLMIKSWKETKIMFNSMLTNAATIVNGKQKLLAAIFLFDKLTNALTNATQYPYALNVSSALTANAQYPILTMQRSIYVRPQLPFDTPQAITG